MADDDDNYVSDLRGLTRLVIDATTGVTDIVERMHHTIQQAALPLGEGPEGRTRGITGVVYETVRTVTGAVGSSIDLVLAQLEPLLEEQMTPRERLHAVGVLNAVIGDHLETSGNPLALSMRVCRDGQALDLSPEGLRQAVPDATGKLVVFIHGLGINDHWWQSLEPDYGAALARELGFTPLYLRYNTGRHISLNGKQLAEQLDALVQSWPQPVSELVLVGYSMGGLVARSAVHHAQPAPGGFREKLQRLVFLGTPHHGAPLERGGHWVHFLGGVSPYSAPIFQIARMRSAGITDLRHGNLVDADWSGSDRFEHGHDPRTPVPLPAGVACHALAGTLGPSRAPGAATLLGDGLVPVDSALGRHRDPEHDLGLAGDDAKLIEGLDHLRILNHPEVEQALLGWLRS